MQITLCFTCTTHLQVTNVLPIHSAQITSHQEDTNCTTQCIYLYKLHVDGN